MYPRKKIVPRRLVRALIIKFRSHWEKETVWKTGHEGMVIYSEMMQQDPQRIHPNALTRHGLARKFDISQF